MIVKKSLAVAVILLFISVTVIPLTGTTVEKRSTMPKTLKHEEDNGIILWGRPDEYFELEDGNIVALDHKTKSKELEDIHPAHKLQLNVYSYLLKAMGYK